MTPQEKNLTRAHLTGVVAAANHALTNAPLKAVHADCLQVSELLVTASQALSSAEDILTRKGSGAPVVGGLTKTDLKQLQDESLKQLRDELDALTKTKTRRMGFTKKQIEDIAVGQFDGFRAAICALTDCGALILTD